MGMRGSPLRRQLILIAVASILPLAILSAVGLAIVFSQQREAEQHRALEITRALASAVDNELKRSITALQVMGASLERDGVDLDAFRDLAVRTLRTQAQWRSLVLSDPEGHQVAHSDFRRGDPLFTIPDIESSREVVRTGQPAIGSIKLARTGHTFAVRVPVRKDGQVRFVLSAVMPPQQILAIVQHQRVRDEWVISVFDAHGLRVARSRNHEQYLLTRPTQSLQDLIASGQEGTGPTRTLEGNELWTAFAKAPTSGWSVVIGMPPTLALQSAIRSTAIYALALALSVLAGLVAAFVIAARINRKLETLQAERTARATAEEANRAKDQFIAMLGHELRNPIAAISNAARLSEMAVSDAKVQAKSREIIQRQVNNLARLTDDLLDAARAVLGKIELRVQPVNLADAAANAIASLEASGRGGRHEITGELGEAWIDGDPVRIEQVVSNLLVNAVKYTPDGGHVRVRTAREGADAVLLVADDGVGMPPELAARAFDLFVQGKREIDRSQGGLGIGLTLVRRIAEMHHGKAGVASAGEGRGCRFVVRIPATARPSAPAASEIPAQAAPRSILLVEDNPDARETLQALLVAMGHRVETARDGVTGVEKAQALAPDLAIIDVGLPGIDGYEVARRLRASSALAGTYIVALTGYGSDDDRTRAMAAGFDEHLTKPVSPDRLEALLAKLGNMEACPPPRSAPSTAT